MNRGCPRPLAVLCLAAFLPACHEDVVLLEPGGPPPQCPECATGPECEPAPDGTVCESGVCEGGECVATTCADGVSWLWVAAGDAHSCAVARSGEMFCWGRNTKGQLGAGDVGEKTEPWAVEGDYTAVAAGGEFTCGLGGDAVLSCWGENNEGQAATGELTPTEPSPRPLADQPPARAIAAGRDHACSTTDVGGLWCWGKNMDGQLGAAEPDRSPDPLEVATEGSIVWQRVAGGAQHTCAIDWDERLFCWGANTEGQLGTGDTMERTEPAEVGAGTRWSEVAAGPRHTCAIDLDGDLQCWGDNRDGELGLGDDVTDDRVLEPTPVTAPDGFGSIALGEGFSCAISLAGALFCWGRNDSEQLGLGDAAPRTSPTPVGDADDWEIIAAGKRHVCGARTSGGLWCWGDNGEGQLAPGDLASYAEPTEVCSGDVD